MRPAEDLPPFGVDTDVLCTSLLIVHAVVVRVIHSTLLPQLVQSTTLPSLKWRPEKIGSLNLCLPLRARHIFCGRLWQVEMAGAGFSPKLSFAR